MRGQLRTLSFVAAAFLFYCAAQPIAFAKPQIQDSNNPELAEATKLNASVVELFRQGKYKEALPLAKRALQIREKALSPDDDRLEATELNLAEIYLALGKYGDARGLFERVIKFHKQSAPNQPSLADIIERLAVVQFAMGYPDKTEELYKRALESNDEALGAQHPKVARSVSLLAEFYQLTGDFKKAEPLYKRLVAIREKSSSPTATEDLRAAADRYACLLYKLKREDEARELKARVYGPETPGQNLAATPGVVLNGRAISLPRPAYPEEARVARVSGTVVVQVVINEVGNVIRACAIDGPPLLARASETAAMRAKFTSTSVHGQPVKVGGVITYKFVHQ